MNKGLAMRGLLLALIFMLLAGCTGAIPAAPVAAATSLSPENLNLIFVVSPDLAYNTSGDINPSTANLSNQGLQRSLLMATYLKQQVMGGKNVNRIYALAPMTHLQTANQYPDMAALGFIQQFALLNQISLTGAGGYGSPAFSANSYPINASYAASMPASEPLPAGVDKPLFACPFCQGLDFNNTGNDNETLVTGIIANNIPGFHVFSAPWETTIALLGAINKQKGYNLSLPSAFISSDMVYAISITPKGIASLAAYNGNMKPPATYPVLPSPVAKASCKAQTPFSITATEGVSGAKIPPGINTNETLYMVRHAEAHPAFGWDDGNYLGAGQWRSLALPDALRGKINPTEVWSIDPAQVAPGALFVAGNTNFSYVRPALTVEPYAIANNLPYYLVSEFELMDPKSPQYTSDKFFTGDKFSNKTILLAWEHGHFPLIVKALLASYFPAGKASTVPDWPDEDYDAIWTVTLDARGNLTVNNPLCEGIDSSKLPVTAPPY